MWGKGTGGGQRQNRILRVPDNAYATLYCPAMSVNMTKCGLPSKHKNVSTFN